MGLAWEVGLDPMLLGDTCRGGFGGAARWGGCSSGSSGIELTFLVKGERKDLREEVSERDWGVERRCNT